MLKGIRGSLLTLFISIILLVAVIFTRPPEAIPSPATRTAPATQQPTPTRPAATLPAVTAAPIALAPTAPLDSATLHEALIGSGCFTKLNPLLAGYNRADRDAVALMFNGLMKTDPRGAIVPDLASATPTISNDGLIYVFKLRTDVKWHDGLAFTSEDVLTTIAALQADDFTGPKDLNQFWRTVEVDVLDAVTVRFKLAQPLATFTDYLRIGIIPSHVLKGFTGKALATHPFNLAPIGTGPYQFDALIGDGQQRTGMRLKFAPVFAERPEGQAGYALKQIVFHCVPTYNDAVAAFQRGELNTINLLPPESTEALGTMPFRTIPAYRPSLGAVIYNWQRESTVYFRDWRMRQALFKAVDRPALVQQFLPDRAIVADGPILPASWAYTPNAGCPPFDLEDAKAKLALVQQLPKAADSATPDAGATPIPTTPNQISFQLLSSNDPILAAMGESIVKQWNALGITVTLTVVDQATFRDRLLASDFDAALVELNLEPEADPDPYSLWRQEPSAGGLNFGGLNERRLSELMENARRESNGITRADLYQQFQKLFCERVAAVPLYFPAYLYGVDRRLSGVQIGFVSDPSDRFRTIQDWRFNIIATP